MTIRTFNKGCAYNGGWEWNLMFQKAKIDGIEVHLSSFRIAQHQIGLWLNGKTVFNFLF